VFSSCLANGSVITAVAEGTQADVDAAVVAARKAFNTTWGENSSGATRGHLLFKLAELMERDADQLAAIECLDNGKTFFWSRNVDIDFSLRTIRYYAGWADKNQGKVSEVC
jgi:aldehyde dehydrogenase (NAD+)